MIHNSKRFSNACTHEILIRNLLNQVGFTVNTVFHKPDMTHYSEGTSSHRLYSSTRVLR